MLSLPARSAMVRASFRMQRTPGEFVVRPGAHVQLLHCCPEQALANLCQIQAQASSTGQWSRTSAGLTPADAGASALDIRPVPSKRCRCRDASTRSRMVPVLEEQVRGLAQALV